MGLTGFERNVRVTYASRGSLLSTLKHRQNTKANNNVIDARNAFRSNVDQGALAMAA